MIANFITKRTSLSAGKITLLPLSPSRPMSPCERLKLHSSQFDFTTVFTEDYNGKENNSHKRYWHYIEQGVPDSLLPAFESHGFDFSKRMPKEIKNREELGLLMEEIKKDYVLSIKRSIVDYVLLDATERKRLDISSVPRMFKDFIPIRAPVPWSETIQTAKAFLECNLFVTNPVMTKIIDMSVFQSESDFKIQVGKNELTQNYSNAPTITVDSMIENSFSSQKIKRIPLTTGEFQSIIREQCKEFRQVILTKWLPEIIQVFIEMKSTWYSIVTSRNGSDESYDLLDSFFRSVATLMSNQLWETLNNSIDDFEKFIFTFEQNENQNGLFKINLTLSGSSVRFEPALNEVENVLIQTMEEISKAVIEIPRVETKLFTSLQNENIFLSTISLDDPRIVECTELRNTFARNYVEPQRYILQYEKFKALMTQKADRKIEDFIKERHDLDEYETEINKLMKTRIEINSLPLSISFSMINLDCNALAEDLLNRTRALIDKLVEQILSKAREDNSQ
ncbi:Dynein heavy chain domain-containing protein [Rozella allomycis CSF55]|uniref:Dynein heavy chain domain-containing protein n=1 Tax=Rozella allomycis (strain CSF55) TaxID=988480 RepID=A0A075AYS2_ROZAC|nr:Dynein heavy chain domain-containing protein [Rozella allomycis CSF55]|eukprot:EPZ33684.1 Dynein heavy chain domain-containing protein [Rozella allomycis CSF55]